MRTNEGEAASDLGLDAVPLRIDAALQLGQALPLGIGRQGVRGVWTAEIFLRNLGQVVRLPPIDGSGADEEEFVDTGRSSEVQDAARPSDDSIDHRKRTVLVESSRRLGSSMDQVGKLTRWELERRHVPRHEFKVWMGGKMRGLLPKSIRVACQDRRPGVQAQLMTCPGKRLQEPGAEEPRPPCDEETSAPELFPRIARTRKHVGKVFRQGMCHRPSPLGTSSPRRLRAEVPERRDDE